jgi:hypothetical protein
MNQNNILNTFSKRKVHNLASYLTHKVSFFVNDRAIDRSKYSYNKREFKEFRYDESINQMSGFAEYF